MQLRGTEQRPAFRGSAFVHDLPHRVLPVPAEAAEVGPALRGEGRVKRPARWAGGRLDDARLRRREIDHPGDQDQPVGLQLAGRAAALCLPGLVGGQQGAGGLRRAEAVRGVRRGARAGHGVRADPAPRGTRRPRRWPARSSTICPSRGCCRVGTTSASRDWAGRTRLPSVGRGSRRCLTDALLRLLPPAMRAGVPRALDVGPQAGVPRRGPRERRHARGQPTRDPRAGRRRPAEDRQAPARRNPPALPRRLPRRGRLRRLRLPLAGDRRIDRRLRDLPRSLQRRRPRPARERQWHTRYPRRGRLGLERVPRASRGQWRACHSVARTFKTP